MQWCVGFLLPGVIVAVLAPWSHLAAQSGKVEHVDRRYQVRPGQRLRVDLRIDAAEVEIASSGRARELRVSLAYHERGYDVQLDFDADRSRFELDFDKEDWVDSGDRDHARIRIALPVEVETELDARIKAGEVDLALGGLALVGVDLRTWAGEVTVAFDAPNRVEMDYLKINTRVGETDLVRLGNARFRRAEIDGGIGEMRIDLRGALLPEAETDIDLDIGETWLRLPPDAGVKLRISKFLFLSSIELPRDLHKLGRYYTTRGFDDAATRLYLTVSPGLGELRLDR